MPCLKNGAAIRVVTWHTSTYGCDQRLYVACETVGGLGEVVQAKWQSRERKRSHGAAARDGITALGPRRQHAGCLPSQPRTAGQWTIGSSRKESNLSPRSSHRHCQLRRLREANKLYSWPTELTGS